MPLRPTACHAWLELDTYSLPLRRLDRKEVGRSRLLGYQGDRDGARGRSELLQRATLHIVERDGAVRL